MIRSLYIRDYLLIPEIHIDFADGLTVITGETGAGKSLIVDSLSLAVGARADTRVVRKGSAKAEIIVVFDASDERVSTWLKQHELEDGGQCILRRIIHRGQPSTAFVNGTPVTNRILKTLGAFFVDIHSQHEHQLLLKQSEQRRILDGFAGQLDTVAQLGAIAKSIRSRSAERIELASKAERLTESQHLIRHQIEELDELKPENGEFEALETELAALSNAEELAVALHEVAEQLHYSDDMALSAWLLECERRLNKFVEFKPELETYTLLLEEARIRVNDVSREIRSIADRTAYDPQRIAAVEERMSALQHQARIHNASPDRLGDMLNELRTESTRIESDLSGIQSIDAEIRQLKSQHREISSRLSEARKDAATAFSKIVTEHMQGLGMKRGVFEIEVLPENSDAFASYGSESVRFMVATNPGQQPDVLSKVVSGGELSRLSLAVQVNASELTEVSSIVFDEIDVGIGGRVAESIGRLLRQLGKSVQIFCITHLPQVASCGDHQLNVTKSSDDESSVQVRLLTHEERITELARMLGGAKITARATEHAKEMLSADHA